MDSKIKIGIIGGSGLDNPKFLKNFKELKIKTPFGKPSSKITSGILGKREIFILSRHNKKHSIVPTLVPFSARIGYLLSINCHGY